MPTEDDPYSSPYQLPDTMPPIVDPGAAAAAATQAGHFAQQHRGAIAGREKEIRDIQEKQQLNTMRVNLKSLDDEIRRGEIAIAEARRSLLPA